MAQSFADVTPPPGEWLDLAAVYPALAGQAVTVQYKGGYEGRVFFGGASAPGAGDGGSLRPGMSVTGTADHIWVRAWGAGTAPFYAQIED